MEKRKHPQQMDIGMYTNTSISISMHKTQAKVHQRPQYKSRYTEPDRRKNEEQPCTHWHMKQLPE